MPRLLSSGFVALLFIAASWAAEPGSAASRFVPAISDLAAERAEKLDLSLPAAPTTGKLSRAVVWIHVAVGQAA